MDRLFLVLLLQGMLAVSLFGQDPSPASSPPLEGNFSERMEAVDALVESIRDARNKVEEQRKALSGTLSEFQRDQIEASLRELNQRITDERFDLLDVATDEDLSGLKETTAEPFSLQGSLEELVRPLIQEIKRSTQDSREAQELSDRFDILKDKQDVISSAMATLDALIARAKKTEVVRELKLLRTDWAARLKDIENQRSVVEFRLNEILAGEQSFLGRTRNMAASFFRVRGKNLLLAVLASLVVFVGLRILDSVIKKRSPLHAGPRSFGTRLFDVLYAVLTVLATLGAAMLVFFFAGDWVLLGLVILVLVGVALTAKDTIPGFVDEARLLLNLGTVREGERIVYNGIPWKVEDLTFFTILRNPALRGGMVRMPVAQLGGYLSRPVSGEEPYFPSREGDWVLLDDGIYGNVMVQSPEMVQLKLLGGAEKTYQTAAFLGLNPKNHSHGFRVTTTIGIDYANQPESTTTITDQMRNFFKESLAKVVDPAEIVSLKVEFELANASSLDYTVLLDLKGSMAPKYFPLQRALQRIGVDACNAFGWTIPFQQITLHKAQEQ